ncbi:MAG: ADP-ribosylglycohydrolase family protein [SAR324 cluster bacterium]|nr:ADP-ribosylglycohydrolase family protein [SAR324 cluster bacterium]
MKKVDRIRGAILGAAVADAAGCPLHWIYDRERMESLLKTRFQSEFWPTSESLFYSLPAGAHCSNFDTTLVVLRALGENSGKFNPSILLKIPRSILDLNPLAKNHFKPEISGMLTRKRDEKNT